MKKIIGFIVLMALCASCAFAQSGKAEKEDSEEAPTVQKFFRLDFVLREIDGNKEISKRNYTVTTRTATGDSEHIRTGTRVPVTTGPGINGRPEFQYMDVGVNIDTHTREKGGVTWLGVTAELSSIAIDDSAKTTPYLPPLVRQAKITGSLPLTPGKSIVVFAADEPTSSRRFELSVTATQLK